MSTVSVERLVNGSGGDPCLYVDFPGADNALLFDCGELAGLDDALLQDVGALFFSHFHMDHFAGFDRLLRRNLDRDKTITVFGPAGTAERIAARARAYQHFSFPFMKLRFLVHDIADSARTAQATRLDKQHDFEPQPLDKLVPLRRGLCHESPECRVKFAFVEHTVTCINYAMELKRGWRLDHDKLAGSSLRPGKWVGRVVDALRRPKADRPETIAIDGGEFPLAQLAGYFSLGPRAQIAFITDTRLTADSRHALLSLAKGATRLYCDAYYPHSELKRAVKYGHMTVRQAAELARDARAKELVLIHIAPRFHRQADALLAEARDIFPATTLQLDGTIR